MEMTMKQLMLATVASLALSLPAMAQSTMQHNNMPAQQGQQNPTNQMNNPDQSAQNNQAQPGKQKQQQAENVIRPSQLSHQQVRQIQQALNKKGFDAKHVDGIWGRETTDALNNFQKKNDLQGHGELTQQTLAQLGVNVSPDAQQSSETTGSGSNGNGTNGSSQNPGMTGSDRANSQTTGQGSEATGQKQNSSSQPMNQTSGQSSGSANDSGSSSGSTNTNK
jgi:hypothetical protein